MMQKKTKISESYKPSEYYKHGGTTLITLTVCHNKKVNAKKNLAGCPKAAKLINLGAQLDKDFPHQQNWPKGNLQI